jgi:hypothetical protein
VQRSHVRRQFKRPSVEAARRRALGQAWYRGGVAGLDPSAPPGEVDSVA